MDNADVQAAEKTLDGVPDASDETSLDKDPLWLNMRALMDAKLHKQVAELKTIFHQDDAQQHKEAELASELQRQTEAVGKTAGLLRQFQVLLEEQHRERSARFQALDDRLAVLEAGLDRVLAQTSTIGASVERCVESAEQLNTHIGFVESVYHSVRTPLEYAARRVGLLLGTTPAALPEAPFSPEKKTQ